MEDNKSKIEVKVDLPFLKVSLSTEVSDQDIDSCLNKFLDAISKANKKVMKIAETEMPKPVESIKPESQTTGIQTPPEGDPLAKISMVLDIETSSLKNAQILGIKDGKVQIFKPQKFSPAEAILVLAFCYEFGLKEQPITYDKLKQAYQDSGVKGSTPFRMALNNIKISGYIDKNKYDSTKEVILTPKGAIKAGEYIKKAISTK